MELSITEVASPAAFSSRENPLTAHGKGRHGACRRRERFTFRCQGIDPPKRFKYPFYS
jgi:hypothetical protein